jgi:hypothetical protein
MVRSVDAALSKSGTRCGAFYGDTSTVRGQQQQFDTSTTVHGACERHIEECFVYGRLSKIATISEHYAVFFYSFEHVRSQPYVGVVMRKRMVGFKLSQPIPDN